MERVLTIVALGRAARMGASIKNRQPIAKMFVGAEFALDSFYADIIKDELNVKEVEFITDAGGFMSYTFKPQLRTVGPKYGKYLGQIKTALSSLDGRAAMAELNETGAIKLALSDTTAELTRDDLIIETAQTSGYETASDKGVTVVLDTVLTPELIEEGFVREIVSKIQNMRKDSGFEVMDNIEIYISGNEKIAEIASRNADEIMGDTLAKAIIDGVCETSKEWNLNGEDVTVGVKKIAK